MSDPDILNYLLVGTIHQAFEYTQSLRRDGFELRQRIADDRIDAPVFTARRSGIRGPGLVVRIEVRSPVWVLGHAEKGPGKVNLFDSIINFTDVDATHLLKPVPQIVNNLVSVSRRNGSLTETMRTIGRVIRDIAPEAADYLETWEE